MRLLRAAWTWMLYDDFPCTECGRRVFYPGALRADVCEVHYLRRLAGPIHPD